MAKYVVYVNADQIQTGTEQSVTSSFAQCGFSRAMKRDDGSLPLATLLFIGESSFSESQLARHLEKSLRANTMCDIHVIVFQMAKLRSRSTLQVPATRAHESSNLFGSR